MCSRLIDAEERIMPHFRCDMLDQCGDIIFLADIVAESPSAAIQRACRILQTSNQSVSPSQRVSAFEV